MSSGVYRFSYVQDQHEDHRVDAMKFDSEALDQPEHVFPEINVEVVLQENDADLTSLLAAFRRVLVASGFSPGQSQQIVVIPFNQVEVKE